MSQTDSNAEGEKLLTMTFKIKSLQMEALSEEPRTPEERQCSAWTHCRSYSSAFIRYLWLLFNGTVKAYHNLEVVFNSKGDDCITRLCPITLHI